MRTPSKIPREPHGLTRIEGESNDCSILATAAVLSLPYAKVHKLFEIGGRKRRGLSFSEETHYAWKALGYRFEETDHSETCKTMIALEMRLAKDCDTLPLLVFTRQHLTAFVNTRCIDYTRDRVRVRMTGRLVYL